jgi:hypothetical protein
MSVAELGVSQEGRQTYIITLIPKQKHSTFVYLKVNTVLPVHERHENFCVKMLVLWTCIHLITLLHTTDLQQMATICPVTPTTTLRLKKHILTQTLICVISNNSSQ